MFSTNLSTRSCDGRAVVALRGELDLVDAVAVAAALTAAAVSQPQIIVDLAGLEFIDSSGVAALARGRRQAWQAGGDLVLAAPQREVMLALALTRLSDAFRVFATVEEAAGEVGNPRERHSMSLSSDPLVPRQSVPRPAAWHGRPEQDENPREPSVLDICNQI